MILEQQTQTVNRSQNFKKYTLNLNEESFAHIFSMLSQKLYSNKIKSAVSEVFANAHDSHIKAGKKETPFDVYLPCPFDPNFRVVDYGTGMTDQEVEEIYSSFGMSTKRGDNDQSGAFGIGRCSLFGISNNFLLICKKNGTKNTYSVFLNEIGLPEFTLLNSESCDAQNGVEISVPVEQNKIYELKQEVKNILKFYKVKPNVHNDSTFQLNLSEYYFKGEKGNWGLCKDKQPMVIMANYAYPINHYSIPGISQNQIQLINSGVHIECNLGQVSITPNREQLQYDEKTIKFIKSNLDLIAEEIKVTIEEKFKNCKDFREAYLLYRQYFHTNSDLSGLKNIVGKTVGWNGKKFEEERFSLNNFKKEDLECIHYFKDSYNDRIKKDRIFELYPRENQIFIENDLNFTKHAVSRMRTVVTQFPNHSVYLIKFTDSKIRDEFKKQVYLENVTFQILSAFAPTKNTNPASEMAQAKLFVYKKKDNTSSSYRYRRHYHDESSYWLKEAKDLKTGGFYVKINRYKVTDRYDRGESPSIIDDWLGYLKEIGITIAEPVYGVKVGAIEGIKKKGKWINLLDYLKEQLNKYITTNKIESDIANISKLSEINLMFQELSKDSDFLVGKSKMREFLKEINHIKQNVDKVRKVQNIMYALSMNCSDFTSTVNLQIKQKDIYKTYPLLAAIVNNDGNSYKNHIFDYCRLIDNSLEAVKTVDNNPKT